MEYNEIFGIIITMGNNMDDYHRHNVKKVRQTHTKYILYDSISMKFKTGKTKSTVVMQNSGYLIGSRILTGRGQKRVC